MLPPFKPRYAPLNAPIKGLAIIAYLKSNVKI